MDELNTIRRNFAVVAGIAAAATVAPALAQSQNDGPKLPTTPRAAG